MSTRPLWLPPKDLSKLELRAVPLNAAGWFRLHWPGKEAHFTLNPEHRFSPADLPWPVLYCASDVDTAVLEVFGDRLYQKRSVRIARAECQGKLITPLKLPSVQVADLTKSGMRAAKVDVTALVHRSRKVTHAWGRAVSKHSVGFHGVLFHSRFTLGVCVALFRVPGDTTPEPDGPSACFHSLPAAANFLREYRVALT